MYEFRNEFRKDYEYEDEKEISGLLRMFFVILVTFEILSGIVVFIQASDVLSDYGLFRNVFFGFGLFYFGVIILTAIALNKIRRFAVIITKSYLALRFLFLSLSIFLIFFDTLNDPTAINPSSPLPGQYASKTALILSCFVYPMLYVLASGIFWFVYFIKSKRVKSTYGPYEKKSTVN